MFTNLITFSFKGIILKPRLAIYIFLVVFSNQAFALPTPDALINVFQLFPLLAGGITGSLTIVTIFFRKRLNKFKDPIQFLTITILVLSSALIISIFALILNSSNASKNEQLANISMYFRSDVALDEIELKARSSQNLWFENGLITELQYENVNITLEAKPLPLLFDLSRLKMTHDSGILALKLNNNKIPFQHVRAAELQFRLKSLLAESNKNSTRPIVFLNWERFSNWHEFKPDSELVKTLEKFDYVYALPKQRLAKTQALNEIFEIVLLNQESNSFSETKATSGKINYPVRKDYLAFNEEAIVYPNLLHLFQAPELVTFLKDPNVLIIAPYNALYRSYETQTYFLSRFLKTVDETRIHYIDFNSASLTKEIELLGAKIAGRPFITVGLSKQDWIYMGVDIAYSVWLQADKNADNFHYLGSSVQLPEAATILTLEYGSFSSLLTRKLQKVFDLIITSLANWANISLGISLLCFAIVLRLLLSPIGYLEAYSRNLRSDLKSHTKEELKTNPDFFLFINKANVIAKIVGCKKYIEIIGGLISLVLILPFYSFIKDLNLLEIPATFYWVSDIFSPSSSLSAILILVIIIKILIGKISLNKIQLKKSDFITLLVLIGFYFLFENIMSAVIIYALGIIGTQAVLDIIARVSSSHALKKTLVLKTETLPTLNINSQTVLLTLSESTSHHDIGNKARKLGDLLFDESNLFIVPNGFLLTSYGIQLAENNPEKFTDYVTPKIRALFSNKLMAIRSCGLAEDGAHSSLAGRYDTLLNIGCDDFIDAVLKVAASFDADELNSRSIIVQQMADVDIAGVLFSQSPDNAQTTAIEYNSGLADKLVSGETKPVLIKVGRYSGAIQQQGCPELNKNFTEEQQNTLYIKLSIVARLIEKKFGAPQDIEWGYSFIKDQIYIIQTRDITASVQSKVIADVQAQLLTDLTKNSGALKPDQKLLKTNDISEVVNKPTPFTTNLLLRLYSNDGALGLALQSLGFAVVKHEKMQPIVSVAFGNFFDINTSSSARYKTWVKNTIATKRIEKRIKHSPIDSYLKPLNKKLSALQQETSQQIILQKELPDTVEGLLNTISNSIAIFEEKYYAIAYETTLLAKFAKSNLPQEQILNSGKMITRTSAMFAELRELTIDDDFSPFLSRWGHRGEDEYELAASSYSEKPEMAKKLAHRMSKKIQFEQPDDTGNIYDQFVYLKEFAKDESIRYLRTIKPAFIKLSEISSVPLKNLYSLSIGEIHTLNDDECDQGFHDLLAKYSSYEDDLNELRSLSLVEDLSIENIEFLDYSASNNIKNSHIPDENKSSGQMISSRREFNGKICIINSEDDFSKVVEPGMILLTQNLSPRLVPLFENAAGCISKNGGMLSHAAIVAREMNFPVLVGVNINDSVFVENKNIRITKQGHITFEN